MADPGSEQNEQIGKAAPDWRTAYCRLKEEGDGVGVEEERERDWCWQVSMF